MPDLPDALLHASRLPPSITDTLLQVSKLYRLNCASRSMLLQVFHFCGTPRLECSLLLSGGGPRRSQTGPRLAPDWSPNCSQTGSKLGPNCSQTVSRLCLNCAQTVPRHAVARAIARVTGEAYRLTRLTRHSLACCQISPDSPNTLLHDVRIPRTCRHSLACFLALARLT